MGKALKNKRGKVGRPRGSSATKRNTGRRKPAARSQPQKVEKSFLREALAVALLASAVFIAAALWSHIGQGIYAEARLDWPSENYNVMGPLGALVADICVFFLGWCSFSLVIWSVLLARTSWAGSSSGSWSFIGLFKSIAASGLMLSSCTMVASILFGYRGGGEIGARLAHSLVSYVNEPGAVLFGIAAFVLSLGAATDFSMTSFVVIFQSLLSFLTTIVEDMGYFLGKLGKGILASMLILFSGMWSLICSAFVGMRKFLGSLSEASREGDIEEYANLKPDSQTEESDSVSGFVLGTEVKTKRFKKEVYEEAESSEKEEPLEPEVRILRRLGEEAKEKKKVNDKTKAKSKKKSLAEKNYRRPDLALLVNSDVKTLSGPKDSELIENSRRLEEALRNFRIGGRVVEVHPGPVVTLYQFSPAAGVKVQRIVNLSDDLALALRVASVRVYAPVPGKGTVGIEVPNKSREIVRLRDVLESSEFHADQNPLPLALGKDTYGEPFVANLPRMPHLLIAGATGTGKSVCINSILLSLLFRSTPEELNLILIDPKMLELSIYEDIPHLKAPVVTNAKRARGVLWWAVEEMERRYRLLKDAGVRDIAAYNRLSFDRTASSAGLRRKKRKNVTIPLQERDVIATGSPYEGLDRATSSDDGEGGGDTPGERLPRIVVVVDELADLMLTVGREIEELLTRLAQKARAAGIHLILATQRPSVNVITGLIKANFPARVSFKVAGKVDARTVMDQSGAEKLLGQGDMLFLAPWIGQVRRLHSPYVSDQEVHDVCDWLRAQGEPEYDKAIEDMISKVTESEGGGSGAGPGGDDYDEFYDSAVSLVIDKGQASTSMVQRAFRIGYNRAARILEVMEREGVVGPADGSKPRQVLVGNIDGA